jgi:hypothetical protein
MQTKITSSYAAPTPNANQGHWVVTDGHRTYAVDGAYGRTKAQQSVMLKLIRANDPFQTR